MCEQEDFLASVPVRASLILLSEAARARFAERFVLHEAEVFTPAQRFVVLVASMVRRAFQTAHVVSQDCRVNDS